MINASPNPMGTNPRKEEKQMKGDHRGKAKILLHEKKKNERKTM